MIDNRIKLLKSLADETRYNIIKSLLEWEKTVSQIVKEVKKAQPTISLHLKLLQLNNIVNSRKKGKFVFYKIKDPNIKKIIDILEDKKINLLKSLADETRLNIIETILEREKTVSEIVKEVKKAQPTISLHLKLLQLNNIITSRKQGKFIFYRIKDSIVKKIIKILE